MKRYNIVMVYDQEFKKLLFCKRKKRPYIGKLNFPGGKWEEGETYTDAAYRELREETGITKDAISPMFHLMDYIYITILEVYWNSMYADFFMMSNLLLNQMGTN